MHTDPGRRSCGPRCPSLWLHRRDASTMRRSDDLVPANQGSVLRCPAGVLEAWIGDPRMVVPAAFGLAIGHSGRVGHAVGHNCVLACAAFRVWPGLAAAAHAGHSAVGQRLASAGFVAVRPRNRTLIRVLIVPGRPVRSDPRCMRGEQGCDMSDASCRPAHTIDDAPDAVPSTQLSRFLSGGGAHDRGRSRP